MDADADASPLLNPGFAENADRYRAEFARASPFRHVVVDDFLRADAAAACADTFWDTRDWVVYFNPIEIKRTNNRPHQWSPAIRRVFDGLFADPAFVVLLRHVTDIPTLEFDEHLHGAGLQTYGAGGKLDLHLDYSLHPISGKERRLNLLLYLNREWDTAAYGGALELRGQSGARAEVAPLFNRMLLFETTDASWHGVPRPLTCPDAMSRDSLACYYVSQPRPNATPRFKAQFVRSYREEEEEEEEDAAFDAWYDSLLRTRPYASIPPQWQWKPAWHVALPAAVGR